MAIPLYLPQEYVADVYLNGEARGGGFALSEIPHPYHGLLPDAKVPIVFDSAKKPHKKDKMMQKGSDPNCTKNRIFVSGTPNNYQ